MKPNFEIRRYAVALYRGGMARKAVNVCKTASWSRLRLDHAK
jgi:hypothetical protein